MKKGILCILLSVIMLLPVLTSCQQEADFSEKAASVYTLYTIVDESTTKEDIINVELALNRIIYYRLNMILKLEAVTEAEYDDLIAKRFEELQQIEDDKKIKKDESSKANTLFSNGGDNSEEEIMTGDRILSLLSDGQDIPLKNPRLDIFLVRGYDNYYELATNDKLAALDEKLNNEAKSLKSSIHSTLFTAAKVNNKTYGVPVNNAIGNYTYLVFDKELLEKYGVDPNTIKSMEDLNDYLREVKSGEKNVIPLKNTYPSASIDFLSRDGFPAIVTSTKSIVSAYDNDAFNSYISMITRYKALGYFESEEETDDPVCAVSIESGNIDDIKAEYEKSGRECVYSLYSNPIATNENAISNIFCISKFVVSNELTDVVKLITALNTDEQLMNILAYGVENVNYTLNEKKQVVPLRGNTYSIKPEYTGNCFLTYTLATEDPDKWVKAVKQNQDARLSPSVGFTSSIASYVYTVTAENATEEHPAGSEVTVYEPDYIEIINGIVEKYYPALMDGTALTIDYAEMYAQAQEAAYAAIRADVEKYYIEYRLNPAYIQSIREAFIARNGAQIRADATASAMETINYNVRRKLRNEYSKQWMDEFKKANPDASENDAYAYVETKLTDEFVAEHLNDYFSEEDIQTNIDTEYQNLLSERLEASLSNAYDTPAYIALKNRTLNSEEFKKELEIRERFDGPVNTDKEFDRLITEEIKKYTGAMIEKMNTAIEEAITGFVTENKDLLGKGENEFYYELGYYNRTEKQYGEDESQPVDDNGDPIIEYEYSPKYETAFEYVLQEKITNVYYKIFGTPDGN